jgi:hypothetical protein
VKLMLSSKHRVLREDVARAVRQAKDEHNTLCAPCECWILDFVKSDNFA